MKKAPEICLSEYIEEDKTVTSFGTIRVNKTTYSLPSNLKGSKVRLRIYEDKIEVLIGVKKIIELEKENNIGAKINYRHVIETFRRKPGAFAHYRYKDQMFPTDVFRLLYEILNDQFTSKKADKEYIEILYLAFKNGEEKVSKVVERRPIFFAIPSCPATLILSPTIKGLSVSNAAPPKRLLRISCAAKANAKPPIPRPATSPVTSILKCCKTTIAAIDQTNALTNFFNKG